MSIQKPMNRPLCPGRQVHWPSCHHSCHIFFVHSQTPAIIRMKPRGQNALCLVCSSLLYLHLLARPIWLQQPCIVIRIICLGRPTSYKFLKTCLYCKSNPGLWGMSSVTRFVTDGHQYPFSHHWRQIGSSAEDILSPCTMGDILSPCTMV